jgi:hypothetical protein
VIPSETTNSYAGAHHPHNGTLQVEGGPSRQRAHHRAQWRHPRRQGHGGRQRERCGRRILSPGASPGILAVGGDLTLASVRRLRWS